MLGIPRLTTVSFSNCYPSFFNARDSMKLNPLILTCLFILCSISHADELEKSRIELEANKKIYISKSLSLTDNQSTAFWKIFASYEQELGSATKDSFDLIRKFSEGYQRGSISEQDATNMLAEFFRIEARKLQIKQSYLPRYQEILPTKQVFRFYQIDNKVDTLIRCDIAKKLPLIEAGN